MNPEAFFVSIPHSGTQIPQEAFWLLDVEDSILNCDVDWYVDELYQEALKEFHIPSVYCPWHRYAADMNRSARDISCLTVEGAKPRGHNQPSDIHWKQTTKGEVLIKNPMPLSLHQQLIDKYFHAFHQKIAAQIEAFKKQGHQDIYLLDLHSMPSVGLDFHRDTNKKRKDIILGTHHKKSSNQKFIDLVYESYKEQGFEVAVDWPYSGGYITQHYGDLSQGQHVIQIEINRRLYIDESTKEKTKDFQPLQKKLKQAIQKIISSTKN